MAESVLLLPGGFYVDDSRAQDSNEVFFILRKDLGPIYFCKGNSFLKGNKTGLGDKHYLVLPETLFNHIFFCMDDNNFRVKLLVKLCAFFT